MYRKGVSALVINDQQEFLLVNLESFEERFFAIPGGGLDAGESLESAVYRELFEELSISRESLELAGKSEDSLQIKFKKIKLNRDGIEYIGSERYFFGFRFIGDKESILPKHGEVRSFKWVPYEELGKYLLFDGQLEETTNKIREIFPDRLFGK